MYSYLRRLEHIQITKQQAALVVLALYFVSAVFVIFIALTTHAPDNTFIIPGAISGSILFGAAWILYYKTKWDPIRYFAALASSLLVGLFLPEPFVTSYAPMVVVIPAVLALLLTGPIWVIVNSLLVLAVLFIRAGGNGVYAHPTTLIFYAMIVGALVVSRLIEETSLHRLKHAEEATLQSERQMSALVSSLDDIVIQFDDQGTYLNVWTADENLLVQPKNELLGKQIQEVLGEEPGRLFADAIRRVAAGSQPENIEYHLDVIGGRRWFRARINPVLDRDLHQQTVSMLIRDITDRKQAEVAILESEQKYRTLTENLKEVVYRADPITFRIIFVNQAVENIYGYSVEACLNDETLWESMIHPEDRQNVLQSFRSAQEQAKDSSVEHRILRKDGVQRWVIDRFNWEKSPSGRIAALSGVVSDITERKQYEQELQSLNVELERHVTERTAELERANRTKDEFLANMSHELRTPLNSILGLSEALLEQRQGPLNEHQQKSLQIVEESGRHLLDLINDVLDLSKIEAGKFDFYPQSFSVDDVCRSSLAFIKAQATKKSIRVTYSNKSSVLNILADSRRLKQILVNLLTNAVKFTPNNGHVTLEVKTNLEQELIQFSVIDTGVGIAAADMQRLFQPFVQLDSSLNRQYQGTGLGLALVQKLADLHGGSISVESEVGKGSCFTVNLACSQDIPARLEGPTQEHPGLGSRSGKEEKIISEGSSPHPVILLAEDNMPNILTIAEYLESYEYRVEVAHDGLEAIAKAEEVSPALILMDIQMPAMNGLQAIAHLRTNPRFALTPIIALTALAMPGDRERCLAAGASDYLSKPVSLKLLRNSIETMLRMGKG